MYKIKRYFQGVVKQAKMVRWPKRIDLLQSFAVVMVILVVCAVMLSIDDLIIANILKTLDKEFISSSSSTSSMKMIQFLLMRL